VGGFLTELGKKLAERWLTLLVLPGALYVAALAAAGVVGHTFAFSRLASRLTGLIVPASTVFVLAVAALLAAAAAGLAAQALGSLVERAWLAERWTSRPPGLRHLARFRVRRRRHRWSAAQAAYHDLTGTKTDLLATGKPVPVEVEESLAAGRRRVTRIAVEEPARPGWIGDRMHAVVHRIDRDYLLDLPTAWPHLWLIAPEETRTAITDAKAAFRRAATLAGRGWLYTAVAAFWWPATVLVIATLLTAHHRARSATETYAALIEATARLHTTALATALGMDHAGPLDRDTGWTVTCLLQGRPDLIPFTPEGRRSSPTA
jgi:hypothetical protein